MRIGQFLKFIPSFSVDELETIGMTLSQPLREVLKENTPNSWSNSFGNFFFQMLQYIQDNNIKTERLAAHNFKTATANLQKMHTTFAELFKDAPDYFDARTLNEQENKAYSVLVDLLDVWILEPPKTKQRNISTGHTICFQRIHGFSKTNRRGSNALKNFRNNS